MLPHSICLPCNFKVLRSKFQILDCRSLVRHILVLNAFATIRSLRNSLSPRWVHAVLQLVAALRYNPEGRGFDSL